MISPGTRVQSLMSDQWRLPVPRNTLVIKPLKQEMFRLTFHAEKIPDGSVMYNLGERGSDSSKPMMSVEMPKGLTPPDCVYFC